MVEARAVHCDMCASVTTTNTVLVDGSKVAVCRDCVTTAQMGQLWVALSADRLAEIGRVFVDQVQAQIKKLKAAA